MEHSSEHMKLISAVLSLSASPSQDDLQLYDRILMRAVLEAPRLKTLILRLGDSHFGDDFRTAKPIECKREGKAMLPSLQNLKIIGQTLKLSGDLADIIPYGSLKILELWNCGNSTVLLGSLMSHREDLQLSTLKIINERGPRLGWLFRPKGIQVCQDFVVSIQGLKELALEGYGGRDMAFVTWHSHTLEKLTWLDHGKLGDQDKAEQLEKIQKTCRNLRSLRIYHPLESLRTVSVCSIIT